MFHCRGHIASGVQCDAILILRAKETRFDSDRLPQFAQGPFQILAIQKQASPNLMRVGVGRVQLNRCLGVLLGGPLVTLHRQESGIPHVSGGVFRLEPNRLLELVASFRGLPQRGQKTAQIRTPLGDTRC